MAATRSYETWAWTGFTVTPYQWLRSEITFVTNMVDWLVLCKIPRADVQYTVDGETVYRDYIYAVGLPAAVTPSPISNTIRTEFIAGDSYGYNLGQSFWGLGPDSYWTRNDYIIWGGADGNGGLWGDADYTFESIADFEEAIDNGDIHQIKPKVYFDVYIDGTDMPSIAVNWTASEDLSPITLQPEIWFASEDLSPDPEAPEIITRDGIKYPDVSVWNVVSAGSYSYGGSLATTYLSIMNAIEPKMSPPKALFKTFHWGFDGKPGYVRLYLRMNNAAAIGELQRTQISIDGIGSNTEIADSGNNAPYDTIVRIHTGEPDYVLPDDDHDYPGGTNIDDDGPGPYDPDDPPPISDFEDDEGIGFDGNAVLTRTYVCSASDLVNIGQKLWSQAYFNVLKVQNNPIENIVSVKAYPMAFTGGTTASVKVGDIDFGVSVKEIASVQVVSIGSLKYEGYYSTRNNGNDPHKFLDYAPFTKCKLNLPYIGLIELDPNEITGRTIHVDYIIDLVTGQVMAVVTLDAIPFLTLTGQIGFDIPLTATDRVQTELRVASAAVTAVGSAAGHIMAGDYGGAAVGATANALNIAGADYTSQRTASPSPACASYANHMVYLLIDRPLTSGDSAGYPHLHGRPCHKYTSLGSLSGFVAVDARTDIKIAMTSEENAMLEQLLTQGIYI